MLTICNNTNNYLKHAYKTIRGNNNIKYTNLEYNKTLSKMYGNNIYLKREDLQTTRSFKIRGSYNAIANYYEKNKNSNINNMKIITASAGNHAQGVALSCNELQLNNYIFLPETTPQQKIDKITYYGGKYTTIIKDGLTFDETAQKAIEFYEKEKGEFIHPFNNEYVIYGQSTVGTEIFKQFDKRELNKSILYPSSNLDYILCPVGGGGLISGLHLSYYYYNNININKHITKIYGIEPQNANSLYISLKEQRNIKLNELDTFVDGASVAQIGDKCFEICKSHMRSDETIQVSTNKLCNDIIDMYNSDGIVLEPAGGLSISALDELVESKSLYNQYKNIVCIASGGNNDILRYNEMLERKLNYLGLKKYYIIKFGQKNGELKKFINSVLTKNTDITRFEYLKKNNKDKGSVLLGLEFQNINESRYLEYNMRKNNFEYINIDEHDLLYNYLI